MKNLGQAIVMAIGAATFCAATAQGSLAAPASTSPSSDNSATPVLVDSGGKTVGRFTAGLTNTGTNSAAVVISYKSQPVLIEVAPDLSGDQPLSNGLTWRGHSIYFTSDNCTGQAYVDVGIPWGSRNPVAALKQGNQWTAYVGQTTMPRLTQFQSTIGSGGACGVHSRGGFSLFSVPVEATLPLDSLALPPFYVK